MIIIFLKKLLEATKKGIIQWKIEKNDNEEIFVAKFDDTAFFIEIIYLPLKPDGKGSERSLVRIYSNKLYETFAIGTEGYELIMAMLEQNISDWKEAKISYDKKILALTKMLDEKILKKSKK